jgi:hypothetical protein
VLNPVCRRLIDHVKARGGQATRAEVHAALPDVPDRTRNYNLSRLLSAGLLAEDGGLLRTRAA